MVTLWGAEVKPLSHQADFSTLIKNKVMSFEQVATSGNRFKHDGYTKKLLASLCVLYLCVYADLTHTRARTHTHTHTQFISPIRNTFACVCPALD